MSGRGKSLICFILRLSLRVGLILVLGFSLDVSGIFFSLTAHAANAADKAGPDKNATQTILFIGDSLTAGYGVKKDEAFPAIIERKLKASGHNVKVTNAGISGSVTAESDRRLRWFLKMKPDILVLALGGNDALKGTPPKVIKENLAKTIDLARANDVKVVLAGIKIFTNFGDDYVRDFENVYKDLAREKNVTLIPFLLEGVALDKSLNLPDGKHPNAKGHERVAEHVLKTLEPML